MFSTFKILVIYLIISSRCTCIPNGKTATLSFEEKVEKELDPLKDHLEKIMVNVPDSLKVELAKIQGNLEGEMKKIIERAVGTEIKNEVLIKDQGALEKEKENVIRKALKTFVVPYLCRNFEMYEQIWDNGGTNSKDFNSDDNENAFLKQQDLSTQTMENYKHHAKVWDRILTSSKHPLVKIFKDKIKSLYPTLTLPMIAKNLGLVHALLNNAKHGAVNDEPDIVELLNPDSLIVALKEWKSMRDPVLLNIIKAFEQVVSGS